MSESSPELHKFCLEIPSLIEKWKKIMDAPIEPIPADKVGKTTPVIL